jgi:spore coat polysaccharide biosynthesis protein SpsF
VVRVDQTERLPRGLILEVFSHAALQWLHLHTMEARHREHVTYYVYEYPNEFRIGQIPAPPELLYPLRLTIDTPEDLELARRVADRFAGNQLVPASQVVRWLLDHPETAALNAHIQQAPIT